MAAASPMIAVVAKLKATTAITAAVGGRIYPQLVTQEVVYPFLVVTILGAETSATLAGKNRALKKYTVRIDSYAETELEAGGNAKRVRDALAPDGTPWQDAANGVQGCFHTDTVSDFTDDEFRFQGETFDLWHEAT
jgi:hypothetical protein